MSQRWGQNFLVSPAFAHRIVDEAASGDTTLEIGPGHGALTRLLVARNRRVHAVEIDHELADELRSTLPGEWLTVYNADILEFDFDLLGAAPVSVIGNIPYEITSPLIERLLLEWRRWSGIVLLVQKEVAERICGVPGTRNYSALAAMVAAFGEPCAKFDVHRSNFRPVPKVDSTLVVFTLRQQPLVSQPSGYPAFLKRLFSQRRKKLINSLGALFEAGKAPGEYDWVGLERRVEAVDPAGLARLYDQVCVDSRASIARDRLTSETD